MEQLCAGNVRFCDITRASPITGGRVAHQTLSATGALERTSPARFSPATTTSPAHHNRAPRSRDVTVRRKSRETLAAPGGELFTGMILASDSSKSVATGGSVDMYLEFNMRGFTPDDELYVIFEPFYDFDDARAVWLIPADE